MKNIMLKLIIISVFFQVYLINNFAQCSDAGVCSVGGHSFEKESENLFSIYGSYKFGASGKEDDVKYHSFQLGALYNVLRGTDLQLFLPYNIQTGPLGDVSGIGDLILSLNQNLLKNDNSSLDASAGIKLATGEDNENNLPMAYQSGLGSNDVIIALNYSHDQIRFGVGYQIAGERNDNIIKLKRGDDLLVRASYNFLLEKLTITPQLLFIQRLGKSSIVNELAMSPTESYVDVENSDQSQVNLLTQIQYIINTNYSLIADFAIPFIERENNVDGLTRSFSASIGVQLNIK